MKFLEPTHITEFGRLGRELFEHLYLGFHLAQRKLVHARESFQHHSDGVGVLVQDIWIQRGESYQKEHLQKVNSKKNKPCLTAIFCKDRKITYGILLCSLTSVSTFSSFFHAVC